MSWLRIIPAVLVATLGLSACVEQEPDRPTEDDVKVIKQNILSKAPDMKFKVNAELEDKIVYLGLDVDKATVVPGEPFKLTHYWKVLKPADGWLLFVHLNGPEKRGFINADHKPIGNRYPVASWKAGEIIRDEHTVALPAGWKDDKLMVYTGLWKGKLRMKIKGPQDDESRVLAVTLPVAVKSGEAPKLRKLVATKAAKAPKIDGKLDDPIWSKAAASEAFVDTMTGAAAPTKSLVKAAWDDKNLYLAFTMEDDDVWSSLKERDDKLWTQEAVEVFIDANGDGKDYIELQVNPNGAIFDSYLPAYRQNQNDWNSKMVAAVAVDGTLNKREDKDKGWTVEVAIPWEDTKGRGKYVMALPPKLGDGFKVNFFRMDLPKGKPQQAVAWSPPLVGDFHKLDRFGLLVFGDEEGKVPEAKPAAKPKDEPKVEEKKEEKKAEEKKTENEKARPGPKVIAALPDRHSRQVLFERRPPRAPLTKSPRPRTELPK
jgi:hypothetical protein